MAGFRFAVIAAISAWRARGKPSDARVAQTAQAVGAMAWPAFAAVLESAFQRDAAEAPELAQKLRGLVP